MWYGSFVTTTKTILMENILIDDKSFAISSYEFKEYANVWGGLDKAIDIFSDSRFENMPLYEAVIKIGDKNINGIFNSIWGSKDNYGVSYLIKESLVRPEYKPKPVQATLF